MTHPKIRHMAEEFAGVFYDSDRSATFRANWPDQMEYVRAKWPHFVVAVRAVFAEMLTRKEIPDDEKIRIYEALLADGTASQSSIADAPLQLSPGDEQYQGNRKDNHRTEETWGKGPGSLRSRMMRTTSNLIN